MTKTRTQQTGVKAVRHMTKKQREQALQIGEVMFKMMEEDYSVRLSIRRFLDRHVTDKYDRKLLERAGLIPSDKPNSVLKQTVLSVH